MWFWRFYRYERKFLHSASISFLLFFRNFKLYKKIPLSISDQSFRLTKNQNFGLVFLWTLKIVSTEQMKKKDLNFPFFTPFYSVLLEITNVVLELPFFTQVRMKCEKQQIFVWDLGSLGRIFHSFRNRKFLLKALSLDYVSALLYFCNLFDGVYRKEKKSLLSSFSFLFLDESKQENFVKA